MGGSIEANSLADCVARVAAATPQARAVVTADKTLTYAELEQRIQRTAHMLQGRGIGAGDRVAICAANRVEIIELLFTCARLGAILVLINNRLTGAEIRFQLDDCKPSLVIAQSDFSAAVAETGWDFEPLSIVRDGYVGEPAGTPDIATATEREASLDDDVLLVYTSGTTGTPKGAVLTQGSLYYTILNGIEHEGFNDRAVTIAVLPMFHVGGLNIQFLPCLYAGGTVIIEERFDAERLLRHARTYRATHLLLVPAIMTALEAVSPNLGDDLASLGALNCGSSVVSTELIDRYDAAGIAVVQVYGATETGPTSIVLAYGDAKRFGSCGKAAAHTEVRIENHEGRLAAPGEVGELVLRGPNLFDRYWQNELATAAAIRDGWYYTGDLGYIDGDGFTFVTGRSKEMIISGGENIYPAELEQVIEAHPGVVEAAVVAQSDDRWGEVPVAFVVSTAGEVGAAASAPTVDELKAWTQEQIASYKQPRSWVFVEELPRTSLGKVQKHRLIAEEFANQGETV